MYDATIIQELIKTRVRDDTWRDITHSRVGSTDCWVGRINYHDGSYDLVEGQDGAITQVIARLNQPAAVRSRTEKAQELRERQRSMALRQQQEVARQKHLLEASHHDEL